MEQADTDRAKSGADVGIVARLHSWAAAMHSRRRKLSPHGLFFLAFCSLGAPALVVGSGCTNEARASKPAAPEDGADAELGAGLDYDPTLSLAPMLSKVKPAVVSIQAMSSGERSFNPFGGGAPSGGIGSGFIVSADGHVVTNHHVVDGRDQLEVHLEDGRRFRGQLVGSDPQTDIAVIQLEGAKDLPYVRFGSSEELEVGDWVIAVGSPMGLRQTVTRGILSAKGRGSLGLYRDGYADFLQTDAAINPGNSGGPLFNLRGEVVGINTAVGGHDGLGFAVPVDQAKVVVPKLLRDGKVVRGWLGVTGIDAPPDYGEMPVLGAVVGEVRGDTPAAKAGIQAGDRVVAVDGRKVEDFDDLRGRIGDYGPGEQVEVELLRGREAKVVTVTLGERPGPDALARINGRGAPRMTPTPAPEGKGGSIDPKTPFVPPSGGGKDLYQGQPARLSVEVHADDEGLVVDDVVSGGLGERLGLQVGDRIVEINGERVRSVEGVLTALERDRGAVKVTARRGDGQFTAIISGG